MSSGCNNSNKTYQCFCRPFGLLFETSAKNSRIWGGNVREEYSCTISISYFPVLTFQNLLPGNQHNAFPWILDVITAMKIASPTPYFRNCLFKKWWEFFFFCRLVWLSKHSLNCFLVSVFRFSVWTALETMLSEYCATIEITENVDPRVLGK